MSNLNQPEPAPKPSTGDCWQLVIADMQARREMGIAKYGCPVQPFNGRKQLVDMHQELLDAVVYSRAAIEEDEFRRTVLQEVLAFLSQEVPNSGGDLTPLSMRLAGIGGLYLRACVEEALGIRG